jgi:hypothetical protein
LLRLDDAKKPHAKAKSAQHSASKGQKRGYRLNQRRQWGIRGGRRLGRLFRRRFGRGLHHGLRLDPHGLALDHIGDAVRPRPFPLARILWPIVVSSRHK